MLQGVRQTVVCADRARPRQTTISQGALFLYQPIARSAWLYRSGVAVTVRISPATRSSRLAFDGVFASATINLGDANDVIVKTGAEFVEMVAWSAVTDGADGLR
jgi:hypothetical protein